MRRFTEPACGSRVGRGDRCRINRRLLADPWRQRSGIYEGARLLIGDQSAPIENGAFVVQNGRITAVGRKGAVNAPANAAHVDLTGKTVMPGMINVHVHIGYEGYTSWGAEDYTPANIVDHLQRELFYGVVATQTVGSSPTDSSIQFIKDQDTGKFPPASRFLFMPGMAPPNGGPDATLKKGTDVTHAIYEVSTGAEARAACRHGGEAAEEREIWVDDRRGTPRRCRRRSTTPSSTRRTSTACSCRRTRSPWRDQKIVVGAGAGVARAHGAE